MNNHRNEVVTYDIIKNLDKNKLSRLSCEKVLSACIIQFKDGQEIEVLEFLFGAYIECVDLLGLEDLIFKKIFPKIDDYANMVLYNLYNSSEAIETIVLSNGSKLMEILASLLSYIKQFLGEFHLFEINTLQAEILQILAIFLEYSESILNKDERNSSDFMIEFRLFFKNCLNLQSILISIIAADNIHFFDEREVVDEFKLFIELLQRLVNIAGKLTKVDFKASANLWKCITKLVHNYSYNLKSKNYSLPNTFDWLDNSVKFLTEEIKRNLTNIETLSSEQLTRNFKIISFCINVLLKFSNYLPNEFFYGSKHILTTIMFCLRLEKCSNSMSGQSINQHSSIGLLNVLFEIYKNSRFINELHQLGETTTNYNEYSDLCLIIIKRIIKERSYDTINLYFRNANTNIVRDLFNSIENSYQIVTDIKYYQQIIGCVSNLVLGCVENRDVFRQFEIILVQLLIQNDSFIIGTLAIDLWTVILGNFQQETIYFYFKFWVDLFCRWNSLVAYPAKCFIKILLKNIYQSLGHKFKLQFYNENVKERCKIWSVLGLDKIPNSCEQLVFLDDTYFLVNVKMENCLEGILSVLDYEAMLNHLKLLSSAGKILKPNDQFHCNLDLLLKKINSFPDINKFTPFVIVLLKLLMIYRNVCDSSITINEIKQIYSTNLLKSLKLEILFILQKLDNSSNNLNHLFANETDVIILALINSQDNIDISSSNINHLPKLDPIKFEHLCDYTNSVIFSNEDRSYCSSSPKRIKLGIQTVANIDVSKDLEQLNKIVDNITSYSRAGQLDNNNMIVFSKILYKANNIVNNW